MRNIVYIGRAGCASCLNLRLDVIEPLKERYPGNVELHSGYDAKIKEVNDRKRIDRIPLIVVEYNGQEEFRYSGYMSQSDLEAIIKCEAMTLDEVFAK